MLTFKKLLIVLLVVAQVIPSVSWGQAAPVRGEVSAGVYENIKSTSQALNVSVTGSAAPVTSIALASTAPTVTNSSTTILAANTARKSVLIQNNHATAIVYLNFATTATTADLQIGPGQSIYLSGIIPTTAVRGIGSVASNTAVVVMEGQ